MTDLPQIERIDAPSVGEFEARYVRRSRPVILRGAIDEWPALRRWSAQELKARFGDREVPVVRARGGTHYDVAGGMHYEAIRLGEYIERLTGGQPLDLYVLFRVHEVLPELFDDIVVPPYCRDAGWLRSKFWFAAPGTRGPLHRDLPENLYAQVSGHKRFLLLDRRCTRMVYRHSFFSGVPNFSPVDAEAPDLERYPLFRDAPLQVAELAPGELLYIPSFWWHQAAAGGVSISINLWWVRGPMVAVVRAAELFMRWRGLRL